MSTIKNHGGVWGRVAGGALIAGSFAAACGSDFTSSDCKATRTCAEPGQAGEGGQPPADESGTGSGGDAAGADDGATAGAGGAEVEPQCRAAADCSNGDGADGAEACVDGTCRPGDPPPRVVSVSPGPESESAEPDAAIAIEFSEALEPASVTADNVQLLDGGVPVPGKLSYEAGVAKFLPDARLRLRATYEVLVSDAVTDEAGTALLEPFRSTFAVRDGAWHMVDLAQNVSSVASTFPMTNTGAILLAWSGMGASSCPASAAWLPLTDTKATRIPFVQTATDCHTQAVATGSNGVGAFAWSADGSSYVQQSRAGAWQAEPTQATTSAQSWVTQLAVSPLGVTSRFERAVRVGTVMVSHTSAEGVWQPTRDQLVPDTTSVVSPLSVAFDQEGNGAVAFTAWDSKTDVRQVMVSRYTVEGDRWESAQVLPGSAGAPGEADYVFGDPTIAMAPTGEAMVAWRAGQIPGWVRGSYFAPGEGWSNAGLAIERPNVFDADYDGFGLTFDGSRFVAAWVGESEEHVMLANTATYEPAKGWSSHQEHDPERYVSRVEHPQIVSDGHGSWLLVWRTSDDHYQLVQRRFVGGTWGAIEPLQDSEAPFEQSVPSRRTAFMNPSGVASLTWPVIDAAENIVGLRALRFF